MLAKSKLDSIKTLVSQALIDIEISHEEFNAVIREKIYEKMEENVRNVSEKQENMRLNSVNSKTKKKNKWVMFMSYIAGSTFLTTDSKHFDFIEWFDLFIGINSDKVVTRLL